MVTRIKNINSFILNSYIETVNTFVGEKIICETNEEQASNLDDDTFNFFEKLAHRIDTLKTCKHNCIFRKD